MTAPELSKAAKEQELRPELQAAHTDQGLQEDLYHLEARSPVPKQVAIISDQPPRGAEFPGKEGHKACALLTGRSYPQRT